MSEGKRKFIEDAARVIDGRVAALKAELAGEIGQRQSAQSRACDRAAIMEAELCASLIRQLARAPYRGAPYLVASDRRNRHGDILPKCEHGVIDFEQCPECRAKVRKP